MTAIEQYLIDTYRAAQQGAPMPPPPGRDDVATVRALHTEAQFRAVLAGRPLRPRRRTPLSRWLHGDGAC
ncbi:hypothetical protein [Streptomyces sp. RerS4]|uniref:hypothetical protein n=1 Tax=Streptomyces sp. RerS4 TaxID=2942449 RepID=UPI00201C9252|nr:hypothetical protein [Streptomyces sp. RerS4]UQX01687.1 hypothetical protein M4D82_15090 [Streptomyces sp. RerS4]